MAERQAHRGSFLPQRGTRTLHKPGDFFNRGFGLRVRLQRFQIFLGVRATCRSLLLRLLSHKGLRFYEALF